MLILIFVRVFCLIQDKNKYCNNTGSRDTIFNNEYDWNITFVCENKV